MSIDAMKLALHTLEGWANHGDWVWPESALEQAKRNTTESITALRAAIEQAQKPVALEAVYQTIIHWDEGGGKRSRRELARRIVDLYTVPQPQMQPCAGRNCGSTNPNLRSAECFEDYEKSTGMNQYKPLTEEEINNSYLFWIVDQQDIIGFGRSIETKLRKKNT